MKVVIDGKSYTETDLLEIIHLNKTNKKVIKKYKKKLAKKENKIIALECSMKTVNKEIKSNIFGGYKKEEIETWKKFYDQHEKEEVPNKVEEKVVKEKIVKEKTNYHLPVGLL